MEISSSGTRFADAFRAARTPDEIIMAILSRLNTDSVSANPRTIHTAIYRLSKNPLCAHLLEQFAFDCSGLYPFSDQLDQCIFRLSLTGCIFHDLSSDRYVFYRKELLSVYRTFSLGDQAALTRIASMLEALDACELKRFNQVSG